MCEIKWKKFFGLPRPHFVRTRNDNYCLDILIPCHYKERVKNMKINICGMVAVIISYPSKKLIAEVTDGHLDYSYYMISS